MLVKILVTNGMTFVTCGDKTNGVNSSVCSVLKVFASLKVFSTEFLMKKTILKEPSVTSVISSWARHESLTLPGVPQPSIHSISHSSLSRHMPIQHAAFSSPTTSGVVDTLSLRSGLSGSTPENRSASFQPTLERVGDHRSSVGKTEDTSEGRGKSLVAKISEDSNVVHVTAMTYIPSTTGEGESVVYIDRGRMTDHAGRRQRLRSTNLPPESATTSAMSLSWAISTPSPDARHSRAQVLWKSRRIPILRVFLLVLWFIAGILTYGVYSCYSGK